MRKAVFTDDINKNSFFFIDDDRSVFDNLEFGSIVEISVKDKNGGICAIHFSVTRNAFLGSYHRRIYGEVLGTEDNFYRQIEIRLDSLDPKNDRIDVFMQAPPLRTK